MSSLIDSKIPVIDLTDENLKPGSETWFLASQIVRGALEANGYFYVKSDKISMELQNSVLSVMEELLELPLETKKQKTSDKFYHSYVGQTSHAPLYESIGIDFDGPINKEAVQNYANIMWPTGHDLFWYHLNLSCFLLYLSSYSINFLGLRLASVSSNSICND